MSEGDVMGMPHTDIVPAAPFHRPMGRGNSAQRVKDKNLETKESSDVEEDIFRRHLGYNVWQQHIARPKSLRGDADSCKCRVKKPDQGTCAQNEEKCRQSF